MKLLPIAAILSGVALLGATAFPVHAAENRFYFANQSDFGAKRGFYLDVENHSEGDTPCRLETLHLILGVADGNGWQFPQWTPSGGWEYEHDYAVRAVIDPVKKTAELSVDGKVVAQTEAGFTPQEGTFLAGDRPGWASGPAEYVVRQSGAVTLTVGSTAPRKIALLSVPRPLPVFLFEPQDEPAHLDDLRLPAGQTIVVETSFRLQKLPTDLKSLAPFVDRYGQSRHAEWVGKVKADADLATSVQEETKRNTAWGAPKGYDAYGGYKTPTWHENPTGFYRTVRHDGRWWLISPDGNPTFYVGLCTAPALAWEKTPVTGREWLFEQLPSRSDKTFWGVNVWGDGADHEYAVQHTMNLTRRFGTTGWEEKANAETAQRLSAWGFSGFGKWCDPVGKLPTMPVLSSGGKLLVRHIDPFDPASVTGYEEDIARQIGTRRSDPSILGWSIANEYDGIVTRAEVTEVLTKHPDSAAAKALRDLAAHDIYNGDAARRDTAWKTAVPDADLEKLRHAYADKYYAVQYAAVKKADPDHLYFGFWIVPGWWENEEDWRLISHHCDVIGYDRYAPTFTDPNLSRLMQEADKPVLCGEFSFPAWYGGARGYGRYAAANALTDTDAGKQYTRWVSDAAQDPYCVGVLWFQYRDQPITGRGPGSGPTLVQGEHYAFGLVDITDRPKWDLVDQVRTANLRAVRDRLAPAKAAVKTAVARPK